MDFGNIVREKTCNNVQTTTQTIKQTLADTEQSEDFVDDPDVPPLI
jgi:hypothetical protein